MVYNYHLPNGWQTRNLVVILVDFKIMDKSVIVAPQLKL